MHPNYKPWHIQRSVTHSNHDWYKVLQIDRNDNDAIIKKQYKKFALQLHPDKNKFAGAESAFKLIGEAQRVLWIEKNEHYLTWP